MIDDQLVDARTAVRAAWRRRAARAVRRRMDRDPGRNYPPTGTRSWSAGQQLRGDRRRRPTGGRGPPADPGRQRGREPGRLGGVEDGSPLLVNAPTDGGTTDPHPRAGRPDTQTAPVGFLADGMRRVHHGRRRRRSSRVRLRDDRRRDHLFGGFKASRAPPRRPGSWPARRSSSVTAPARVVTDPQTGTKLLWETCDYSLGAFSPDGRYIVGLDACHDRSRPVILDARPASRSLGGQDGRTYIGVTVAWTTSTRCGHGSAARSGRRPRGVDGARGWTPRCRRAA